jgi:uracil-DNA glycosylase
MVLSLVFRLHEIPDHRASRFTFAALCGGRRSGLQDRAAPALGPPPATKKPNKNHANKTRLWFAKKTKLIKDSILPALGQVS